MTSNFAKLREAANEVALEDSMSGEFALILAANKIATERGMSESPTRRSVDGRASHSSSGEDSSSPFSKLPKQSAFPDEALKNPEEDDVSALFASMQFVPQQNMGHGDAGVDVDALLNMAGIKPKDKDNDKMKERANGRYLKYLNRHKGDQVAQRIHRGKTAPQVLSSKIAALIQHADDKGWLDKLRPTPGDSKGVLRSALQETLLLNMKVLKRPNESSARSKGTEDKRAKSPNRGSLYSDEYDDDRSAKRGAPEMKSDYNRFNRSLTSARLEPASEAKYEKLRQSTDWLCRPSAAERTKNQMNADSTLRYSLLDEARHCTFQPRIAGKKTKAKAPHSDDDGKKEDPKFSFINRQEAYSRTRRDRVDFEAGKKDYDALVDKKICPQCGAKQSFDDVKEKRKFCSSCRVEYVYQVEWNKISKKFHERDRLFVHRLQANREKIEREVEEEARTIYVKQRTSFGKIVDVKQSMKPMRSTMTIEEERELFKRMAAYEYEKELRLAATERKVKEEIYPFEPIVRSKKSKRLSDERGLDADYFSDGFDEMSGDGGRDKVRAFLNRYEDDLIRRKAEYPERFGQIDKLYKTTSGRQGFYESEFDEYTF